MWNKEISVEQKTNEVLEILKKAINELEEIEIKERGNGSKHIESLLMKHKTIILYSNTFDGMNNRIYGLFDYSKFEDGIHRIYAYWFKKNHIDFGWMPLDRIYVEKQLD